MITNTQDLEPAAGQMLRAKKENIDHMSDLPALYSIAISLRRIADILEENNTCHRSTT